MAKRRDTDCEVIHQEIIDRVKPMMPDELTIDKLAVFFKIMGDNTRVRILWALDEGEMCVCDLSILLNMTKSAISHQLKTLRVARLVKFRKEGKNVFYSLDDDHIKDVFEMALEHVKEKV